MTIAAIIIGAAVIVAVIIVIAILSNGLTETLRAFDEWRENE